MSIFRTTAIASMRAYMRAPAPPTLHCKPKHTAPIPRPVMPAQNFSQRRFASNKPDEMPRGETSSATALNTIEKPVEERRPRNPEFSLGEKVILVTGGAAGLGLVITEAILEAGAQGERTPEPRSASSSSSSYKAQGKCRFSPNNTE